MVTENPFQEFQKWQQEGNVGNYTDWLQTKDQVTTPKPTRTVASWEQQGKPGGDYYKWVREGLAREGITMESLQQMAAKPDLSQVEELFPGYKDMLSGYSEELQKQEAAKKDLTSQLATALQRTPLSPLVRAVTEKGIGTGTLLGQGMLQRASPEATALIAQDDALINQIKLQIIDIDRVSKVTSWRETVLFGLPFDVADRDNVGKSADEVLDTYYQSTDISEADRAWFRETYDQLNYLAPKLSAEQLASISPDEIRDILESGQKKNLPLASVSRSSVNELAKYFARPEIKLPANMTQQDLIEVMGDLMFTKEEIDAYNNIKSIADEYHKMWEDRKAYSDYLQAGLANINDPLTFNQVMKLLATQPMVAVLDAFQMYRANVTAPLAGLAITRLPIGNVDPDSVAGRMRTAYDEYRANGLNSWEAYSQAFENTSANGFYKFIAEVVYDPLNLVGMGYGRLLASKFSNPITRFLGALDDGYMKMVDIPFDGIRRGLKYIPRTPGQAAMSYGKQAFMDWNSYMVGLFGKRTGYTIEQARDAIKHSIDTFRQDPTRLTSKASITGAEITSHPFVDITTASRWAKDILPRKKITVDLSMVKDLEDIWSKYWLKVPGYTLDEAADKVITKLGGEITATTQKAAKKVLVSREESIIAKALDIAELATTPKAMMSKIFTTVRETFEANLNSPLWRSANQDGMITSGIVTGWSRRVDRIVNGSVISWVDQHMTSAMANQYLLFANYGPFNLAETVMRNVLGGGDVWYPKNADSLAEFARVASELSTADYNLLMAYRDVAAVRGEMFVGVKQKESFLNRIPGITKSLKGGYDVTLGGRKYRISSLQDFNTLFADLQTRLRAYAEVREFMSQLVNMWPDEMKIITAAVDDPKAILDTVRSLTKAEKSDLMRVVLQDALRGPAAVLEHIKPLKQLENMKATSQINKTMDGLQNIFSPIKKWIEETTYTGDIFKDLVGNKAIAENMAYDLGLAPLVVEVKQLNRLAKAIINNQPGTPEQLQRNLAFVSQMMEAAELRASEARVMVQKRSASLLPKERDSYHSSTWEMISSYLDEVKTDIDYMHNIVQRQIDGEDFTMVWDNVAFEGFPDQFTVDILKGWIDRLPLEIKADLKVVKWQKSPGAAGWYQSSDKSIGMNPDAFSLSTGKETFTHEMMHGLQADKMNSGDYQFFLDFFEYVDPKGTQFPQQLAVVKEAVSKKWDYERFKSEVFRIWPSNADHDLRPQEMISGWFGQLADGLNTPAGFKEFVDSHMPVRLTRLALTDKQKIRATSLNSLNLRKAELLFDTRQTERRTMEDLMASRKANKKFSKMSEEEKSAWWSMTYVERDKPWAAYRNTVATLDSERDKILGSFIEETPIPTPPPVATVIGPAHVAYIFQVTGDQISQSIFNTQALTILPKDRFISKVRSQAERVASANYANRGMKTTAADIGFTDEAIGNVYDQILRSAGFDPVWAKDNPMLKAAAEIETVFKELQVIKDNKSIPQSDYEAMKAYFTDVAGRLQKSILFEPAKGAAAVPAVTGAVTPTGEAARLAEAKLPTWLDKKNMAMAEARRQTAKRFTNYTEDNAIDAAMKKIFPFWTYESQRWFWLPRTFLRTPGVFSNIAKYQDYSDNGYVSVPGTDLQFNLLRGSVFMGGFKRLAQKDYPEYYDGNPLATFTDYIGRFGFYPGLPFMLPQVMFGTVAERRAEWGELTPAWFRTGLNIINQFNPNSKAVIAITQQVMPDRFRDYTTIMELTSRGINGLDIWDKLKSGGKLSDQETQQWASATRKVSGIIGAMMEQAAIFRFRPDEYQQYLSNYYKVIEEMTGVSVAEQERIRNMSSVTGKRLEDYVHVDIYQQKLLKDISGYEMWRNNTEPLQPSAWQNENRAVRQFYNDVEELYDNARATGIYDSEGTLQAKGIQALTEDWVAGRITAKQWINGRSDLFSKLAFSIETLGNSEAYKSVPKTIQERAARYAERGITVTAFGPDEELLNMYYELKPERVYDDELGVEVLDFDTYYASIDAIMDSLSPENKQTFINTIQYSWTPMERLYWDVSRQYIRPYKKVYQLYLDKYSTEQQEIIKKIQYSEGTEREELMAITDPRTGNKLYSQFNSEVRSAREALRSLSPDLDSWLNFFGRTTTFKTNAARAMYEEKRQSFLTPEMARTGR